MFLLLVYMYQCVIKDLMPLQEHICLCVHQDMLTPMWLSVFKLLLKYKRDLNYILNCIYSQSQVPSLKGHSVHPYWHLAQSIFFFLKLPKTLQRLMGKLLYTVYSFTVNESLNALKALNTQGLNMSSHLDSLFYLNWGSAK